MHHMTPGEDSSSLAQDILGYLNFSSGTPDPRFLKNVDDVFGRIGGRTGEAGTGLAVPRGNARAALQAVRGTSDAFRAGRSGGGGARACF